MRILVVGGVAGGIFCRPSATLGRVGRDRRLRTRSLCLVRQLRSAVLRGRRDPRAGRPLAAHARVAGGIAGAGRPHRPRGHQHRPRRPHYHRPHPDGTEAVEPYDVLVLSTGAAPIIPPIDGLELPEVRRRTHVLRNVPDVDAITALVDQGAKTAVILGAGFIGLEMTEALVNRGVSVALVDLANQVLSPLDPEMARTVQTELTRAGVDVHLGVSATAIDDTAVTLSDGTRLPADLVVMAIGVRPRVTWRSRPGWAGVRGAIRVNGHSLTSDPAIYAVGDSVEVTDAVTDQVGVVPLAGLANRQGRAAADHLFGRDDHRPPALGTAIVRVFDVTAATTGASEKVLAARDVDYRKIYLHPNDHAGYYPGASSIHLKLLFAPDGRVLGAQAVGKAGVDKRIDVIATALRGGHDHRRSGGTGTGVRPTLRIRQGPGEHGGVHGAEPAPRRCAVLVRRGTGPAARRRCSARRPHSA